MPPKMDGAVIIQLSCTIWLIDGFELNPTTTFLEGEERWQ